MNIPTLNRRVFLLSSLGALGGPAVTLAASSSDTALYQARTIVTGQRDETRIPGLERCLRDVLVRVSGDPGLADHPRLAELAKRAQEPVAHIGWRDLYAGRKLKDEQGTRDRPFEMTVEYDFAKIDAMLAELGSKPWRGDRPRLVVFLAVHHIGRSYILDSTIEVGELQRESFQDASWKYALQVKIPGKAVLEKAGVTLQMLPELPLSALEPLVDAKVGELPLAGTLRWNKQLLAWEADWRMIAGATQHRWGIKGVNFDAAFRNGVGGAAQILSGNGSPA
jgi:uncharacterized protein